MVRVTVLLGVLFILTAILFTGCSADALDDMKDQVKDAVNDREHSEHEWSDWEIDVAPTCTEKGRLIRRCECGESQTRRASELGHTEVVVAAVAPTCQATGLTEGKYCSACELVFVEQEVLEIVNHDFDSNGVCGMCNRKVSMNLEFTSNGDGTCYVSGIGECKDYYIVIPDMSPTGDRVVAIGESAFAGCSIFRTITISYGTITIADNAFYSCENLTNITIPETVTSIGNNAFANCPALSAIRIPAQVTSIGEGAFGSCGDLASIVVDAENLVYRSDTNCLIEIQTQTLIAGCRNGEIPNGVTRIRKNAVASNSLNRLFIPASVTTIEGGAISCENLEEIVVDEENPVYHSNSNCLIETQSKTLILGSKSGIIPTDGSVINIGDYAFRGYNFETLEIPDHITSIGNLAFAACKKLTAVEIPSGVIHIGERAFSSCYSIKTVVFENGATVIGDMMFMGTQKLKNVTIPNTVTCIGVEAFAVSGMGGEGTITFQGTKAEWELIEKDESWNYGSMWNTIHCTDGDINV